MKHRSWRLLLVTLVVVVALAAGGYAWWNRPAPEPTIEHVSQADGSTLTNVMPGEKARAQVVIATPADQALNDKQLLALSRGGAAQLVQVIVPKADCTLQQQALQSALSQLKGPATLVSGIGPGASLAWRWLAGQTSDNARAVSVGFALEQPGCALPLPASAAHGNWLVAWNDNPDDPSAAFVRDQPNAQTSISDYDIHFAQVLSNELRKLLVGTENGGLNMPVVEVPAGQQNDTVTLFLSGDGGWRDLDKVVAGDMAGMGYPVVGIDVLRYYWEHKSPEQTAADLTELMQHYRQKWGAKRFILAGYSFGADVLPAVYNRLAQEDQDRVDGMILLAFARTGSFEIRVDGWLGAAGKDLQTGPEMAKLPGDKVLCVYGVEEIKESGCTDTTAVGEKLQLPGGHHFDENYPALAKRLIAFINKRQGKTTAQ